MPGYIYDITGDFNASFYTMGSVGMVGGLLALVVTYRYHTGRVNLEKDSTQLPSFEDVRRNRTDTVTAVDEFGSQMHVRTESMTTS